MIMNSWKSTLLSAWAPPLSTFIIGTGQHVGVGAADVALQRQPDLLGGGLGDGQADAEHGVGAEVGLVRRAVEVDEEQVDAALVEGLEALEGVGDRRR